MPESSDREGHPTRRLVKAGEILRTLTPPTFAALHLVINNETSNQSEMADIIGCTRSTVSKYLRSIENLPVPLVMKQGHDYSVTNPGERIFGLIDNMLHRHGTDLRCIDWSDNNEQEEVSDLLTPLYDSRSALPFFILESIRNRSDTVDLHGTPDPVNVEDVVVDVETWQRDIGKSVDAKQIRKVLRRFDDKTSIKFDGSEIILIEKGQEHACLLFQILKLLAKYEGTDLDESEKVSEPQSDNSTENAQFDLNTSTVTVEDLVDPHDSDVSQIDLYESLGSQSSVTDSVGLPTIIPAYCLVAENEEPLPVLPLTPLTTKELVQQATRLLDELGDAQLEPYWTVRTESGLHPVYSAVPQERQEQSMKKRDSL